MSVSRTARIRGGKKPGVESLISVTDGECTAASNCPKFTPGSLLSNVDIVSRW